LLYVGEANWVQFLPRLRLLDWFLLLLSCKRKVLLGFQEICFENEFISPRLLGAPVEGLRKRGHLCEVSGLNLFWLPFGEGSEVLGALEVWVLILAGLVLLLLLGSPFAPLWNELRYFIPVTLLRSSWLLGSTLS